MYSGQLSPSTLWIRGAAGSGKTILAASIIEELKEEGDDTLDIP